MEKERSVDEELKRSRLYEDLRKLVMNLSEKGDAEKAQKVASIIVLEWPERVIAVGRAIKNGHP